MFWLSPRKLSTSFNIIVICLCFSISPFRMYYVPPEYIRFFRSWQLRRCPYVVWYWSMLTSLVNFNLNRELGFHIPNTREKRFCGGAAIAAPTLNLVVLITIVAVFWELGYRSICPRCNTRLANARASDWWNSCREAAGKSDVSLKQ